VSNELTIARDNGDMLDSGSQETCNTHILTHSCMSLVYDMRKSYALSSINAHSR